jgi:hypothetical protein
MTNDESRSERANHEANPFVIRASSFFRHSVFVIRLPRAHGPTGRHRSCKPALSKFDRAGAILDGSTFHNENSERHGPVVQRRRLLAYTQATMVQVHPGSITIWELGFRISDLKRAHRRRETFNTRMVNLKSEIRNPKSEINLAR